MVHAGHRVTDAHECSQLNELKMDMTGLNMLAGWTVNGDTIMVEQMPIFGGYCGGLEETAICDVATTLASFALFNGNFHLDGPIHIRWGTTTNRESLQIAAHAAAAVDANTDLLLANQYYPMAGPCTEMCLIETACQAINDTGSGRELLSGSAAAKGVVQDKTTGMEARAMGEAALTAAGMKVSDLNEIIEKLVSGYEQHYNDAPAGLRFQECYDVKTVKPTAEYLQVYDNAMQQLRDAGLPIKH
ncbi:monomethylamine:corrinoid methyltransferase [Methanoculleus sp. CAG:1088]|nr:monomethylamine:corrinoid methyltransferase [Methanoculleus sp. CAG:1088]